MSEFTIGLLTGIACWGISLTLNECLARRRHRHRPPGGRGVKITRSAAQGPAAVNEKDLRSESAKGG